MLRGMNLNISFIIEELQLFAERSILREPILDSNKAFENAGNISKYIEQKKRAWASSPKDETNPFIQELMSNPFSDILRRNLIEFYFIKYGVKVFTEALVTNKYGVIVAQTGRTSDYRQDQKEWWNSAKEKGFYIGDVEYSEAASTNVMPLAVRVDDQEGNFIGVIWAPVASDRIVRETVIATKKYETTQVKLFNNNGQMIYSTKPFKFLEDVSGKEFYKKIKGESGFFIAQEGAKERLFSHVRSKGYGAFQGPGWTLQVGHDVAEVLKPLSQLETNILVVSLGLIIAIILIAFYLSFSVTKPIGIISQRVDEIARSAGDLTATLPITSRDEIGTLATAFNKMLSGLNSMVVQIITSSERVSTSSQELSSSAQQMDATSEEISSIIQQVSKGTESQATRVSEAAKALEQMTSSAGQVASSAEQSANNTQEVLSSAKAGFEQAKSAVQKMEGVYTATLNSAQTINSLGEKSKEISKIVTVISKIADQTNLLALNAAIEAARAGEAGRGFAVVADEIRKLAESSAASAGEIADLITAIQDETQKAVTSMEDGSKEVTEGRDIVTKAGEAFETITGNIEELSSISEEVSVAAQQKAEGSKQISRAIEEIAAIAEQSASSTQEASASSEEMTSSMQQIATSAQELADIGMQLMDMVKKFKVAPTEEVKEAELPPEERGRETRGHHERKVIDKKGKMISVSEESRVSEEAEAQPEEAQEETASQAGDKKTPRITNSEEKEDKE
jgi:methyl-accepting chemotaxis protein